MITAIVKYKPAQKLSTDQAEQMMKHGAGHVFKGTPGLYSKQFCYDVAEGIGLSVYLWESREIAERFYNDAFMENFRTNLGCTPEVEYWPVMAVLDNRSGEVF